MVKPLENQDLSADRFAYPHVYPSLQAEREDRKRKLAATFRLFGKFGFDEGVAGHVTVRDPEFRDCFWVNPFGASFKRMRVRDLLLVHHEGEVREGDGILNEAAFAIHSQIHRTLPHVTAAAHTHSIHGKSWSALGRLLDPISQDACAFYNDHVVFDDYTGVVLDTSEGERIADAMGEKKAAILQNHGLLTTGATIDEAAWWFVAMERCCQAQLAAEAAGIVKILSEHIALKTHSQVGSPIAGWLNFVPLYDMIAAEQPDLFD